VEGGFCSWDMDVTRVRGKKVREKGKGGKGEERRKKRKEINLFDFPFSPFSFFPSLHAQLIYQQFLFPFSLAWAAFFAISPATYPALNPASMFTTVTFDAQLLSIPSNAATPPKLAP